MKSLSSSYLGSLQFTAEQVATLRKLGEHQGKQELFKRQTPDVLETLTQVAVVESAESSNRIEGIVASTERVRALVLHGTKPKDRSEQEIAGYRDALSRIHDTGSEMPFTTGVIRQLHRQMHSYVSADGGAWKSVDNDIVEKDARGDIVRVRFTPVSAVQTPQAMEDLVDLYDGAIRRDQWEPLIIVPLTILDFLCIHPFHDGNGRIARLLTVMLLYHFNYRVGRYVSLERIIEESRETYYETLEQSSRRWHTAEHDAAPWLNYFWGVLLRAYGEFEDRVGLIGGGRGSKTQRVRDAVGRRAAPFRISDIEADCPGVGRDLIRKVLRALRDEGVLVAEGVGRGARWRRVEG